MTRVKGGPVAKNRRRKVLKQAKGYFGSKHRLYKTAQEQTFHSGAYAYRDRKNNKRNFRKLWITRINAACRENNISYSKFINGLAKANIEINRKMLSEIAIDNPKYFTELVKLANNALTNKTSKTNAVKETIKEEKPVKETENKKAEATNEEVADLNSLTVAQLKEMAKEKNIEGYTTMKKADLISALS